MVALILISINCDCLYAHLHKMDSLKQFAYLDFHLLYIMMNCVLYIHNIFVIFNPVFPVEVAFQQVKSHSSERVKDCKYMC